MDHSLVVMDPLKGIISQVSLRLWGVGGIPLSCYLFGSDACGTAGPFLCVWGSGPVAVCVCVCVCVCV